MIYIGKPIDFDDDVFKNNWIRFTEMHMMNQIRFGKTLKKWYRHIRL